MLRKKYTVQRSIRIDAQLSEDLEKLAKILDRPQSELINLAIENLLIENKLWFKQYIFVDALSNVLENGGESENLQIGNSFITLIANDDNYVLKWELKDGLNYENIVDSFEKTFDAIEDKGKLIEKLMELTVHIDGNSLEAQNYLKHRLNYQ